MQDVKNLENALNDFDPKRRASALAELISSTYPVAAPPEPRAGLVNMHCHTFFSFNAYGHSPSSLAWLGKQRGFELVGIVDFDVLDGVDEFLDACDVVGLRGSAGIETRVFVPEYASQEINSPGEPGVCYHMGIGFTTGQVPDSVAPILADLRQRAGRRNLDILHRVNAFLDPVTIDLERDVLPLTPAGNPTERHMVAAYVQAAEHKTPDPVAFWAGRLGMAPREVALVMEDAPRFQNLIRACLMKRGGVGYIQPESGMFPSMEALHELVTACGALPCAAWLDGTTDAEKRPGEWLGLLLDKGVVVVNIIPDRNWNISDPKLRQTKIANLHRIVEVAQDLDLPLNVGTEMNSFGQRLVDDFDAPELAPVRQAFVDGAHFIYGHTVMQRALGKGYQSAWAQSHLPSRGQRNRFYTQIGYRIQPGKKGLSQLRNMDARQQPSDFLAGLPAG